MTITIQKREEVALLYPLSAQQAEEHDIKTLLELAINAHLLPENVQTALTQLLNDYQSLENPGEEEEQLFFFHFIYHTLYPAADVSESEIAEDFLLELIEKAENRLSLLLPKEIPLDLYFKQCASEQILMSHLIAIERVSQELFSFLNTEAEIVNQKMKEEFEEIKTKIMSFLSSFESANHSLQNKLVERVSAIENLQHKIERALGEGKEIEQKFKGLQSTIKETYGEFSQ